MVKITKKYKTANTDLAFQKYKAKGNYYTWKADQEFFKKYITPKWIYVKGHYRTSKLGKKFYVKPYNRLNPKFKK